MNNKKWYIYLFVLFVIMIKNNGYSQPTQVEHNFNTWWSNNNKYHLSNKWYFSSELHIRRTKGLQKWQQFLFRPAVNYALNKTIVATIGYTFIQSYPYGEHPTSTIIPEHNSWEQITLKHRMNKIKFSHRFRFEQRFIGVDEQNNENLNHFKYVQRVRYRFTSQFPLMKKGKLFGKCFDEIWINQANNLMPLSLNQNWLYLGVGYKISSKVNVECGVMDQVIRKNNVDHYESNPTLQFSVGLIFGKD